MDRFFIYIINADKKTIHIHALSLHKEHWYLLPEVLRDTNFHSVLSSNSSVKNSFVAIKLVKGYWKIYIKIDDNFKQDYFNKLDNICFKNLTLEEQFTRNQISDWQNSSLVLK